MWKYNETDNLPGNSLYHSADELYHYGVLGMRWGHRKSISNTQKLHKYKRLEKRIKENRATDRKIRKEGSKTVRLKGKVKLGIAGLNAGIGSMYIKDLVKHPEYNKGKKIARATLVGLSAFNTYSYAKEGLREYNRATASEVAKYEKKYGKGGE